MKASEELRNIPIPLTKEPYVNTCLYHAGYEKDTGLERYWISSWNSNVGSTGLLINENGIERTFRFKRDGSSGLAKFGFYSACYAGNDIMWLCGDLAQVFRLDLSTGDIQGYLTGAPSYLVFAGMVYDEPTGKLFFSAYAPPVEMSVSFDTRKLETVKIYKGPMPGTTCRGSISNGDGTYTVAYLENGVNTSHYGVWDPVKETFEEVLSTQNGLALNGLYVDGKVYCATCWYDPITRTFSKENICETPAHFFGRRGNIAYGAVSYGEDTQIISWDMTGSKYKILATVKFSGGTLMQLTRDDKIAGATYYGDFFKFDLEGNKLMERELDGRSIGSLDCLMLTDGDLLIGTPFITQRFWIYDLNTGVGYDAGRAADGGGEVLQTAEIGGKIYMSSYTKGRLVEFDPKKPANFPENPRIVAAPQNSMRPVCSTNDGESFYYISNHPYGFSGSEATKYNTRTGETVTLDSPVDGLSMRTLFYNKKHNVLISGSTVETDCYVAKETADICCLAALNVSDLHPVAIFDCEKGVRSVSILGPIDDDRYIALLNGSRERPVIVDVSNAYDGNLDISHVSEIAPEGWMLYSGREGYFVRGGGGTIDLYRCVGGKWNKEKNIIATNHYMRAFVSKERLLLATRTTIDIYDIF